MRVHAIADEALGNTAYLIDVGEGTAVVVDPRRDAQDHLALAEELGVRIVAILETHLHADFVSGARELAEATGAEILGAAEADLSFPHRTVKDGSSLVFGDVAFDVLSTPGHTPEQISYLAENGENHVLFSGGSLIVGGAARTDLSGDERTDELARAQYASLRRVAELADDTALYPTHGGGSFCSTGPARSASSTIGAERAANPLLAITEEEAFERYLIAGFGSYPRYFTHLRDVNRAGAPLLKTLPSVPQITGTKAREAVERGCWLIDGRSASNWSRGHPQGSVSIAVRSAFASWLGWVVPFGAPIIIILDPEQVTEAVRQSRLIGYDNIQGWTTFDAWLSDGLPISSVEALTAEQASDRAEHGAVLLDIRQDSEFAAAHVKGAAHLELGEIILGRTLDAQEIVTYCGHGERAATAASLLARRGQRVATLPGGTNAWRRAGFPVES